MNPPNLDMYLIDKKNFKFEVCKKEAFGKPWVTVVDGLDLPEAIEKASLIASETYEAGIFCFRPMRGFLYWTSLNPDSYFSSVIRIEPF